MTESERQKKEREHEEDLARLRALRPIDDDFMRGMLQDNLPLAQFILRIVTGMPDLVLTKCETQADLKRVTGARSVCLDAIGMDSHGKIYDIEVQRSDLGADSWRARYYSSILDVENLDEGQRFKDLPDTYVIFITERDYFGMGEPVYKIQRMNETLGKPFGDGSYILYVNGEYRGDDDIGRLMHDFCCADAADMHFEQMASRARYLKENPKGVGMMCKAMEDMRNQAWEDGREEGKKETFDMFTTLIGKLSEQGRSKDIERIAYDRGYMERLLAEFSLQ